MQSILQWESKVLNKNICKACKDTSDDELEEWDYYDNIYWENQDRVFCPYDLHKSDNIWIYIWDIAPSWCSYTFQHAVAAGMNND
jgi:hypothetical protein